MPKIKTNSSATKRFKITGTGKLKRKHAFVNHILTKKSKKRKRALGHKSILHPADEKRIEMLFRGLL
ncbi:MAG: 50S ribosomal protein L35 [Bacteroidetes bacterium]|nr:MAG: 50S ribosomal protein L35 [Bacteroidota bacterium]